MNLKQLCKWKLIAGTLLVWAIKFYIRPKAELHTISNFILGVAPNLLGSYILLFGTYLCGPLYFVFSSTKRLRLVCTCLFILLTINEYLQRIPVFGRTFDYNDIIASAIGLYLSYLLFLKWTKPKVWQTSAG